MERRLAGPVSMNSSRKKELKENEERNVLDDYIREENGV